MKRGLFYLVVVLLFACGGNGPPIAAPNQPNGGQAQWLAAALGAPPDASVMIRPLAARSDPYWGPLLNRVLSARDHRGDFISHTAGPITLNSQQIDMHILYREQFGGKGKVEPGKIGWLGVIYGAMPFDPLSIRDGDGKTLFNPPVRMPNGVLVFYSNPNYGRDYGAIAPSAFLVPSGAYIVCDQVTAPRVQQMLAANPAPPPALEAAADSLGGVTFGVTSLRFVDASSGSRGSIVQGLNAVGVGLRGGQGGAVEAYGNYATSDDADRGYDALQRECAQRPRECLVGPDVFRDAKASKSGNRITVQLLLAEKVLNAIQQAAVE